MNIGIVGSFGEYSSLFDSSYPLDEMSLHSWMNVRTGTDAVLFTGGLDVKDSMSRTLAERKIAEYCMAENIPLIGICRGMQLLGYLSNIPLTEHIDGHMSCTHEVQDWRGRKFNVKGDHHQAVPYQEDGSVDVILTALDGIVEAAYFPKVNGFGVQYHPEWMDDRSIGYRWFQSRLKEFIK